ncbi:hypothetical protein [Sabulicella rubraurantiaca]|uniref:hypothetical protein n=1 Tax=Sabulicella rubraurantiaca TaxID=2811429 RepID=UPI001A95FAA0|nr:hypothetical protein [Sabulicella rubraurantiaca]
MTGHQFRPWTFVNSIEEDAEQSFISCSSPPCFLREFAPSFLDPLNHSEILRLLKDLLAVGWGRTNLEKAWLNTMLRRHVADISGEKERAPLPERLAVVREDPTPSALRRLAYELRESLPRIQEQALRRDLQDVSTSLEHFLQRHGAASRDGH